MKCFFPLPSDGSSFLNFDLILDKSIFNVFKTANEASTLLIFKSFISKSNIFLLI